VAPTHVENAGSVAVHQDLNTAPIDTPASVLGRVYPVGVINWSSDTPQGSLLATIPFPDAFLTTGGGIPFLRNKMVNFVSARHGVRLTFRVNGNKFLYGALLCSWVPAAHMVGDYSFDNMIVDSGNNHVIVSLNDAVSEELDCPYHSPDPYYRIAQFQSGCVGVLKVWCLSQLLSVQATSSTSVDVTVFAQMTDAELMHPTTDVTVGSPPPLARSAF